MHTTGNQVGVMAYAFVVTLQVILAMQIFWYGMDKQRLKII